MTANLNWEVFFLSQEEDYFHKENNQLWIDIEESTGIAVYSEGDQEGNTIEINDI